MLSQTGLKEGKPHRCADPLSVCTLVCVFYMCVCVLFNERNINRLFQINFPNLSFLSESVAAFKHIDSSGVEEEREGKRKKERV